jgi:Protein of unknown function (DUF1559)
VREASARSASLNNFKQIALAMNSYAENNGDRLPPTASRDKDGRPLLSWRVLLLPYVEEGNLYKQFHLDEPWDSPHNLTLLPRRPRVYSVPAYDDTAKPPGMTLYQAFTGRDTAFEITAGPRLLKDFPKGASSTILIVEAGDAVPWTKPQDIEYDAERPLPKLGGLYTGPSRFRVLPSSRRAGVHVALADGSARFVEASLPEHAWRWAISRTTKEPQPREW